MMKQDEIELSDSHLNKAHPDEQLFILLGRDRAAPHAIREWAAERVRLGLNSPDDDQIRRALVVAAHMINARV